MGGGSKSKSSSSSSTTYKTTTTNNPYVTSTTTDKGTTTKLQPNTALSTVYDFTNNNMDRLLNEYLNPSINTDLNQAKLNAYTKTLNDETRKSLENNIIAPLSQRNMLRSSQATDLYNNLANKQADALDDYTASLLASSQNDTANMINTLMNLAFQGYNVVSGNQAQSLNTSSGNANKNSSGNSSSSSYGMQGVVMNNIYFEEYLRQIAEDEANKQNSLAKIKSLTGDTAQFGNNLSTVGNAIKANVDNEVAQKLGTRMTGMGANISNGANSVANTLNAPENYFKGVANKTVGSGLSKAGEYLASKTGLAGSIGTGLSNLGASMTGAGTAAGTGAATGAATTGAATGAAAGTAAGAGAAGAGAGAAAGGATAGGAAAGGAAAGGSAAGGAAAAGPIGALVALGMMAAMGTNRKRAKKSGQALMNMTNNIVKEGQNAQLEQTQQNAAALQEQANQALQQGTMTGAAAPIESNPIAEYQNYLRQNGYSNDVVNGVAQGLNSGDKDIANWIQQYNSGAAGKANPINIPQTDEEIAAAKAGTFNTPVQVGGVSNDEEAVKRTLLEKFASGIGDFAKGYQENRNTGFDAENLKPNAQKGKMNRIGEAVGTAARMMNNPNALGLVAGGLTTALTGDPLYGLGQGYKMANQKAMSNIYQDVLAKNGVKVNPGTLGVITNHDMNAIMTPEMKKIYYESLANWRNQKLIDDKEYKTQKLEIDRQNADSRAVSAGASATRAEKYKGGAGGSTKPQAHPDWNSDLAGFQQFATDPNLIDKYDEAKRRFINKHGVDPEKYLK